jgi:hypothetical protein
MIYNCKLIELILPVVPFRETIVEPPETDMVNEELNEENKLVNNNANKEVTNFPIKWL